MQSNFNTNLAFVDLLFNLLIGFVCLFFLSWLLINPSAQSGKITPNTKMMVVMDWPKESSFDIDLLIKGPDNNVVSFINKDVRYMILERDDLGTINDTVHINDKKIVIRRNTETISLNELIPGEYVINIHNYSHTLGDNDENAKFYPVSVRVRVFKLEPFKIIHDSTQTLELRQEKTVITFLIDEKKKITDIRTDVSIPLKQTNGVAP
jgi:hypothetical protein